MISRLIPAIALTLLITGGCVQRRLTVTSDPEGALVYMNNREVGRTPLTRDFTWYGNYDVQLRKEGYETLVTHRWVYAPFWQWVPIDLGTELLPLTDKQSISFAMQPVSDQPADSALMLQRAGEMQGKLEFSEFTRKPTTRATTKPNP